MRTIYEPKGKAREYCELALNLYSGCSHGCSYCYAPNILKVTREVFKRDTRRAGIIPALEKDAPKYRGRAVFLCFTCDPYTNEDRVMQYTRTAIKIFHANEIKVRILTKAGAASERDFDLLAARPDLSCYGATLTFMQNHNRESMQYEPNAALPKERFAALRKAHELGIPTWASLEPVIDPVQTLDVIGLTHSYVDEYKVGKWNYDKGAAKINWKSFGNEVERVLLNFGKKYLIKKDLRAEMDK